MGWFAPSQWRVSSIRSVLGETSEHAVRVYKPRKQAVTIRLDADLVAWFRARGTHYQTEINRALRQFVTEQDSRDRA